MTEKPQLIRLLIADDYAAVREGLAAILKPRNGMDVVAQAANGEEAVERFRECRPDVTLMDLRMPQMDGLEAIGAILAETPDACILVLTSFEGEEESCLRAGATAVVLKDTAREALLCAIRRAYNAPRL